MRIDRKKDREVATWTARKKERREDNRRKT